MKYLKLFESFILEGKIEDLVTKYSDEISEYEISTLKEYSNNSSANFQWLLKHYSNDKEKYDENIAGINILLDVLDDYFKRYLRIKNNLPFDKRDINSLKSTDELIEVINEYNDYDKMLKDTEIDILFSNEKWVVFIPKTYKASNKWGWGRFCTSHDEGYFNYHNINNESLVYIMHKFDYTKNIVIECFPDRYYQIWNYQDDNTTGDGYVVHKELEDIDDGFLDIDTIIDDLPYIYKDDLIEHLSKILYDSFDIDDINQLLVSEFEEKNQDDIFDYIKNNNYIDIYDLRNDIRDSI